MKKLFIILFINIVFAASLFAQVDAANPKGTVQIIDDFENGNYWIWAGSDWNRYGDHKVSTGCNLSQENAIEGKYSLELLVGPVEPEENAIWFYDGSQDLSGGKYAAMDIYNAYPTDITVSFVVQVTENWNWKESERYTVTPGLHHVVFDVQHLNERFDEVKRIIVSVKFKGTCKQETSLFLDNVILIK